jgi:hypothetical protein
MTATREDVLVRPIRPEEYHALGELTVAAYHSLPVMPQQEFYDAQFRNVERRARLSCVPAARHLCESMGFAASRLWNSPRCPAWT